MTLCLLETIIVVANKISAGVSTSVGTHSDKAKKGDEQFEISDAHPVDAVDRKSVV